MNWPTDPPIHPPIHLSKGGSVSTNHKSSNKIELSRLDKIVLKILWFHIFRPTNPPIHPPTHQKNHPPMGGKFSTDSKSSNRIEISWFVQVLSRFYWFGGVPHWGVGGGNPHIRAHAHTHAHARVYDIIGNSQWDIPISMGAAICMKLSCLLRIHARAHACVRVRAHVCGGCPHSPTPPSTNPPKGGNTQNSEISICLELIKIILFCLKNLYLWTFLNSSRLTLITLDTPHPPAPPPWSRRSRNLKNSIKRERIEIIEFRLKICDPWALLHTYRLDLMCRWGGVPSQMALLCFGPKKVHVFRSCDSLDKKFLIFALDPTRPCLDWQLSRFLTFQSINEPFKFDLKWRPKWKIWLKSQFAKEPSTVEIFEMYPGML